MKRIKLKLLIATFLLTIAISYSIKAQTLNGEIESIADVTVAKDGSGDYTTISEALNALPDSSENWTVVYIKKGVYYEKAILRHKKMKVVLVGENVDSTIITYDDYGRIVLPGHTFSTYTFRADAHDFQAYNMTFENTAGGQGQGVAFHANGDRQILHHCRLIGYQDTYFDNFRTRKLLSDCFIEGAVDYIFGFGVSVFDSCQIHTIRQAGYITAASTPQHYEFGYVFRDCRLTNKPGESSIFLGRPWFNYANTVFFECWEPSSISPAGWEEWEKREKTCFYREHNCFGPGSDYTNRVDFGLQLDQSKASRYIDDTIFAVSNFPTELGYEGDTTELMFLYRRFEASGYPERADTILYAGRDFYPLYPSENWSPEYYEPVYSVVQKYTLPFLDSANGAYSIDGILIDGIAISDFDSAKYIYGIELGPQAGTPPTITVSQVNALVDITYPSSIPDYTIVQISSKDKLISSTYRIYNSVDYAYGDASLDFLGYSNTDTIDLVVGVYEYDATLPQGTKSLPFVQAIANSKGAKYSVDRSGDFPGPVYITVTAPDTKTEIKYKINFYEGTSTIQSTLKDVAEIKVSNPIKDEVKIHFLGQIPTLVNFEMYDLKGGKIFAYEDKNLRNSSLIIKLSNVDIPQGIYLYRLSADNAKPLSGKLLVE